MNILDSVMDNFSNKAIETVAQKAGVSPEIAKTVLGKVAPAMTGAMAQNSKTEKGAQDLYKALQNHDDAVLQNPESVSTEMGSKILSHVFGSAKEPVAQELASEVGADNNTAGKLMELFAPMVLGSLGQEQSKGNLPQGDLSSVLGGAANSANNGNRLLSVAMKYADLDGDGQVIDDLPKIMGFVGIVKKFLGGKK